ncbi:hypothetical protein, partial, partial [Parasitella parasitica]
MLGNPVTYRKYLDVVEEKEDTGVKRKKLELDCLITSITEYLPNYQQSLKNLQNNAFEIVGYVRKSPTADISNNRVKLLQQMVDNLRSRSFATRIFVSASSKASTAFAERDLNVDQNIYQQLDEVDGTTQDFIKYLNASKHPICLVVLDFAGLSSRSHHVQELLTDYPEIKKVAVDTFMFSDELFIYDTCDLK